MDSPIKLRNDFEFNGRESVDSGTGDLENDIVEENNNESYIYLKKLKEWEKMGNVKYGHTSCKKNSPEKRLKDSHEEHINVPQYVTLFKIIVKQGEYKLGYKKKDDIFTHIVSKLNYIKGLENKFGIELPNMKEFNSKNFKSKNLGGTEFISNSQECIELFRKVIIVDFPKIGLTTEELDKEEVEKINRMEIEKNEEERKRKEEVERKRLADLLGLNNLYGNIFGDIEPYDYQLNILNSIGDFYSNNIIGKLIWACGLGKALMSLFISKKLKYNTLLVGVPSRNLVNQFKKEAKKLYNEDDILCVASHTGCTTNKKKITSFINSRRKNKIIITTYHSCPKLKKICDDSDVVFDFKIGDEAHHLVGNLYKNTNPNTSKKIKNEIAGFKIFHHIKSGKTLFMTATEKIIINENNEDETILSMEDEKIFGKYIDKKSVFWAIENNKITDYWLYILRSTIPQVEDLIRQVGVDIENKELFLSAYMTLKTFERNKNLTHVLIYANKTVNADLIDEYIKLILEKGLIDKSKIKIDDLYHKSLHSKMNADENNEDINHKQCFDLELEVEKFKNSKLGIISCVQIFGEGFDLPKLNGVVVSEKMDSEIRIVQSLLRPNRLEKENPNKKAFILCPFLDNRNYRTIEKNDSYEKIKNIMFHLRNNDECVIQKTKLFDINSSVNPNIRIRKIPELIENEESLKNIKFCLRGSLKSELSDAEEEYKFVQRINKEMNIKSRKEYLESIDEHSYYFEDPESHFKRLGIWKNWYDFLSVDTSKFIQTKDEWKKRCKELNIKSYQNYKEKISECEELPEDPSDFYYNYNFRNIDYELDNVRERRR